MNNDTDQKQMITRSKRKINSDDDNKTTCKKQKKLVDDESDKEDEEYEESSSSDSDSGSEESDEDDEDDENDLEINIDSDDLKSQANKIQILLLTSLGSDPEQSSKKKKEEPKHEYNKADFTVAEIEKIDTTEKALYDLNRHIIPPRSKVLLLDLSLSSKDKIIRNMNRVSQMTCYSSEYPKLTYWIDHILKVPFGKYTDLPIRITSPKDEINKYFSGLESKLNECIYGQTTAKQKILEFVAKWITNPKTTNEPLAFIGDKGTGKTTLAKEGIAKVLNRPFHMISLGGDSDASSFKGHDYTYEGSKCGKIVDILISSQCMNPIIFFDELDKLSETKFGAEVSGMLMHLTDTTQNDKFSDKYFSGIDFDLSKAMFIFSYNDAKKLNPILRDRLTEIQFKSFNKKEKINIAKDFLLPKAFDNIGLKKENYFFSDEVIEELIYQYTPPENSGVRKLKSVIETLLLRLNLHQLGTDLNTNYKNVKIKKKNDKYNITSSVVSAMLNDMKTEMPQSVFAMYT